MKAGGISFQKEVSMEGSVYKIVEIVGTSKNTFEEAVKNAIETASKTLEDLRIAEIVKMDVAIENGKVSAFRVRMTVSFKYHGE